MSKSRFSLSGTTGSTITEVFSQVDPSLLVETLDAMVESGVGITFAPTRDKSALSVTIMDNGEKERAFCANAAELEALLETLKIQASIT